jgi:hypothetical protein
MGENIIAFPVGIVHVRSAAPPNVPAKNHIGPCCFIEQLLPVVSPAGLVSLGIERSHCHHSVDHSAYDLPYGFESIEKANESLVRCALTPTKEARLIIEKRIKADAVHVFLRFNYTGVICCSI